MGKESVGALCGNNQGMISRCIAAGDVTAENGRAGGLCGMNSHFGMISQCFATGMIRAR